MAKVKITELAAAAELDGTEVLPVVQGGVTKRAPASAITADHVPLSQKGAAGGVAELDGAGKVPDARLTDAGVAHTHSGLQGEVDAAEAALLTKAAKRIKVSDWGWSWHNRFMARYVGGVQNRTYMGGISRGGGVHVGYKDHNDGSFVSKVVATHQADEHNGPAIVVTQNDKMLVFFAEHGIANTSTVLRMTAPGLLEVDTAATKTLTWPGTVTYMQPQRRPGVAGRVDLFARDSLQYWDWALTTDWSNTWSAPKRWFNIGTSQRGYIATVVSPANTDIRFSAYGHPTEGDVDNNEIRYGRMSYADNTIRKTGNISLGDLDTITPGNEILFKSLDLVYKPALGWRVRKFDISGNAAGEPVIFFAEWHASTPNAAMYKMATLTGGVWVIENIVEVGAPFWAQSVYLPGIDAVKPIMAGQAEFFVAREAAGTSFVEKWSKVNGNWTVEPIDTSATKRLVRPIAPYEAGPDMPVIWQQLDLYNSPIDFAETMVWEAAA